MQLRFASFAVINLRRDLHPQECAHAGRTLKRNALQHRAFLLLNVHVHATLRHHNQPTAVLTEAVDISLSLGPAFII